MVAEMPIRWDLTGDDAIIQGADWTRYIALVIDDAGTVWDTTGFTGGLIIRANYDSMRLLHSTTVNGQLVTGLQTIDGQQYCLQIRLSAAATAALKDWGLGVWDLEVTDPYGHVTRVFHGRATLSREVTY